MGLLESLHLPTQPWGTVGYNHFECVKFSQSPSVRLQFSNFAKPLPPPSHKVHSEKKSNAQTGMVVLNVCLWLMFCFNAGSGCGYSLLFPAAVLGTSATLGQQGTYT